MVDRGLALLRLQREAREGMKQANSDYIRYARIEKLAKDLQAGRETGEVSEGYRPEPATVVRSASTLSVVPSAGGKYQVSIDDSKPFLVSELQGHILQILAMDTTASGDGIVAWKTCKSIIEALRLATGKKMTHRALVQAIYLLRERLALHRLERGLIQNSRRRAAYRFALRRKLPPSDNSGPTSV